MSMSSLYAPMVLRVNVPGRIRVGQRDQQLPGAVTVDIGVGSSEIAQCLLDPVRARLQEEPLVSGPPAGGGNSQADFEGHVEPRRAAGEVNPTEVVEGISARRDQL